MSSSGPSSNTTATNRKAFRNYNVEDSLEAGIELKGTEVKSVRAGHLTLDEGFGSVEGSEIYLRNVWIEPYSHGNVHNHDSDRPRRLLLHRAEIRRLIGLTARQGYTLVPLKAYFKRGRLKIQLGLCKGKHKGDKREDLKKKADRREARQEISRARGR